MDEENHIPNSNDPPLEPWLDPAVEARIVALVLGEASEFETAELHSAIDAQPELKAFYHRIQSTHQSLHQAHSPATGWKLPAEKRSALLEKFRDPTAEATTHAGSDAPSIKRQRNRLVRFSPLIGAAAAIFLLLLISVPLVTRLKDSVKVAADSRAVRELPGGINLAIDNKSEPEQDWSRFDAVASEPEEAPLSQNLAALGDSIDRIEGQLGLGTIAKLDPAKQAPKSSPSAPGSVELDGVDYGFATNHALADRTEVTKGDAFSAGPGMAGELDNGVRGGSDPDRYQYFEFSRAVEPEPDAYFSKDLEGVSRVGGFEVAAAEADKKNAPAKPAPARLANLQELDEDDKRTDVRERPGDISKMPVMQKVAEAQQPQSGLTGGEGEIARPAVPTIGDVPLNGSLFSSVDELKYEDRLANQSLPTLKEAAPGVSGVDGKLVTKQLKSELARRNFNSGAVGGGGGGASEDLTELLDNETIVEDGRGRESLSLTAPTARPTRESNQGAIDPFVVSGNSRQSPNDDSDTPVAGNRERWRIAASDPAPIDRPADGDKNGSAPPVTSAPSGITGPAIAAKPSAVPPTERAGSFDQPVPREGIETAVKSTAEKYGKTSQNFEMDRNAVAGDLLSEEIIGTDSRRKSESLERAKEQLAAANYESTSGEAKPADPRNWEFLPPETDEPATADLPQDISGTASNSRTSRDKPAWGGFSGTSLPPGEKNSRTETYDDYVVEAIRGEEGSEIADSESLWMKGVEVESRDASVLARSGSEVEHLKKVRRGVTRELERAEDGHGNTTGGGIAAAQRKISGAPVVDLLDGSRDETREREKALEPTAPAPATESEAKAKAKPKPDLSAETLTSAEPFSTFSLNVSDVSFKLAKTALLEKGTFPESAKVRAEEFVNAFDYGDPMPSLEEKVACNIDQAAHPFLQQRNLMRVSMRTAAEGRAASQPLRLTILLDKSGSMERADREESVLRTMQALAKHLGPADKITAIAFARQPHLIADQLGGDRAKELVGLVAATPSEGGTNLEEALKLADTLATRQFEEGATNRIVLITDGAANLGDADPESLKEKVIELRQRGIAFDACGVGADGLNDTTLEALTRKGDGRYYFLNRPQDADASFVRQLAGSLRPAAKNVKVQVKFNPDRVTRYRLAGFEKHRLKKEDFRNDKVDAAEMAAAESGNALYHFEADPQGSGDVGEVFVRFLDTSTQQMVERSWPIPYQPKAPRLEDATPTMQLAAAAGLLGEKLKGGPTAEAITLEDLSPVTNQLRGTYASDQRVQQLIQMVEKTRSLSP